MTGRPFDVAQGRLEAINASRGGVPKISMMQAVVTETGLAGDRQDNLRFHGGPDRALVLFSLEVIQALQREGHAIHVGSTGENLTLSGFDWAAVVPGQEVHIGADVRLLVTKYVSPCEKIATSFVDGDFTRISQKRYPGWSRVAVRVLAGGTVQVGDPVEIVPPDLAGARDVY